VILNRDTAPLPSCGIEVGASAGPKAAQQECRRLRPSAWICPTSCAASEGDVTERDRAPGARFTVIAENMAEGGRGNDFSCG